MSEIAHHERLRRPGRCLLVLLLTTVAFLSGSVATAPPAQALPGSMEWEFLDLVNQERAAHGLGTLALSTTVSEVAELWSTSMATTQVLSHRPDVGSQMSVVAPNWYTYGENVGYGASVGQLHQAFMNSPGHRANVLNGQFNYVGIGAVVDGRGTIWVTFNFVGTNDALPLAKRAGQVLISPLRPDGVLASPPALVDSWGSPRLDAFVVGTDGAVYWSRSMSSGFEPWLPLGAPPVGIKGAPAGVGWGYGRIDVFVRGGDNRLWQRFSGNGGATWSPWLKPFGDDGTLASAPAVNSWTPGRLDVVVKGTDGNLYQRFHENWSWSSHWYSLGRPGAGVSGDPALVSWSPGRLDIFVRGGDNKLWQRFWGGNGWSGWLMPLGNNGTLASSPSAGTLTNGHLAVAVKGTDGGVYLARYQGGWQSWARQGGGGDVVKDRPSLATRDANEMSIAGWGTDNRCYLFRIT